MSSRSTWADVSIPRLPTENSVGGQQFSSALHEALYEVSMSPQAKKLPPMPAPVAKEAREEEAAQPAAAIRTPRVTPRTPRDVTKNSEEEKIQRREKLVHDLLMEIDYDHIVDIKKAFFAAGGGVTVTQFVRIMKQVIPHRASSESEVVSRLTDLFKEIDVDGDHEMTWDEFTNFVIKRGVEPIDSSAVVKKYQEMKPHYPVNFNSLAKLNYYPAIDKLVVCDNNKDRVIKLYKPEQVNLQTEYSLFKELRGHTGTVLNSAYIDSKKYLVTSALDCTMALWDVEANYRCRHMIQSGYAQMAMTWNAQYETLFSVDTRGCVMIWKPEKWKEKQRFRSHTDMGTDLLFIPNSPLLCTASLDSTIIIWDVNVGKQRQLEGHINGVFSLAYSLEHRFLFSAGSDRDALVWNPVVSSRPVFHLKGHHSSLVGIHAMEGTPQVLTADLDGQFKLWDIRTFECIQTFESMYHQQNGDLTAFCVVPGYNQVVAGGSSLLVFEYDKPGTPWLSMDFPIVAAIYNSANNSVLTAGGDCIAIWDGKTGEQLRVYSNICNKDNNESISAVTLDAGQKKIIVGDSEGRLQVLNYSNGSVIRTLDPHQSLVSEIIYCPATKAILTSSWDMLVNLHDEFDTSKKGKSVFQTFAGHKKDVSAMAFSDLLSLVATGTADGLVYLWDSDKYNLEQRLNPDDLFADPMRGSTPSVTFPTMRPSTTQQPERPSTAPTVISALEERDREINALCFTPPYPVVVAATANGQLVFWPVKPSPNRYQAILKIENKYDGTKPSPVHSLAWDSDARLLYAGDENGNVSVWDVGRFFDEEEIVTADKLTQQARFAFQNEPTAVRAPRRPLRTELKLRLRFKAHYGTVTSMQLIDEPRTILTGSKDRRCRSWSRTGEYYGTLRQTPHRSGWHFPVDASASRLAEEDRAQKDLKTLEDETQAKLRRSGKVGRNGGPDTSSIIDDIMQRNITTEAAAAILQGLHAKKGKYKSSKFSDNPFNETSKQRRSATFEVQENSNSTQFPVLIPGVTIQKAPPAHVLLSKPKTAPLWDPRRSLDDAQWGGGPKLKKSQINLAMKLDKALGSIDDEGNLSDRRRKSAR